jgi:hypothetical protein
MAPEATSVAVEAETEEVAPAAPAAPITPAPQPSSGTPAPAVNRLVDDPAYRKIFLEMVEETLSSLHSLVSAFEIDPDEAPRRAVSAAGHLQHAAAQMGLPHWSESLATFISAPDLSSLVRLIEALEGRLSEDFPEASGAVAPAAAATAARFRNTWRTSASMSPSTSVIVAGSSGIWPDSQMAPPAATAWE